jgi:hypothetical protein
VRPDLRKKNDRLRHFKARLWERYEIRLTPELLGEIKWRIHERRGVRDMWGHAGKNTMAYAVQTSAGVIGVVYDLGKNELVTALPQAAVP